MSSYSQKQGTSPYPSNPPSYLTSNANQRPQNFSSFNQESGASPYGNNSKRESIFDQKDSPQNYQQSSLSEVSPYQRNKAPAAQQNFENSILSNQQPGTLMSPQLNAKDSAISYQQSGYSGESYNQIPGLSQYGQAEKGIAQQGNSYNKQDMGQKSNYSSGYPGQQQQQEYGSYQNQNHEPSDYQFDNSFTTAYDRTMLAQHQQQDTSSFQAESPQLAQGNMQVSNYNTYNQTGAIQNQNEQPSGLIGNPLLDPKNPNLVSRSQSRGHLAFKNANEKGQFLQTKKASNFLRRPDATHSMPKYLDTKSSEQEVIRLKKGLTVSDSICALFSIVGIIVAFVEEEIFFNNGNKSGIVNYILRGFNSFLSASLSIFIYRHYSFQLKILKARRIVYQTTSLLNSGLLTKFIIETIFSWIHCPPGLDFVIPNVQLSNRFDVSLDAYICFIMLFRLYICFRLFDHYTFWTGQRSVRICKMNGFQATPKFAIKAYLKYRAFIVLLIGLGVSILIFGLGVRLFEKPFSGGANKYKFDSIWNSFWCIIVTMCTIGYGDIYPVTHFGRLVTIFACIWGVFLLSLFVVALNNITEFSNEESQAFDDLSKTQIVTNKLSKDAYLLLQTFLRLKLLQKHKASLKDRFLMRMDMTSLAARYKTKRKGVLSQSKSVSDILQEMQDDEEYGVEELINLLAPVKEITTAVENIQTAQSAINAKVLEVHEMSKKLFSFVSGVNHGEVGKISTLKDLPVEYDVNGEKVTGKIKRKKTVPAIDSRTRFPSSNPSFDLTSPELAAGMKKKGSPRGNTELRF